MRLEVISMWFGVVLCLCGAAAGQGQIIYVDAAAVGAGDGSSWGDAYVLLQDALTAAAVAPKPVEIRVAQGTYRPDQGAAITLGDQSVSFELLNGVALAGGYAGSTEPQPDARDVDRYPTVLSGDLAGNDDATMESQGDNSCRVVICDCLDQTAIIDGFTVTGCAYARRQCSGAAGEPVADMLVDGGSPTVSRCRFTANLVPVSGASLLVRGGANPTLAGCIFNKNVTGVHGESSDLTFTGCTFENNQCGLEGHDGSLTLINCRFAGGGGVNAHDCNAVLTGCSFEQRAGGIDISHGTLTLDRCTFTRSGSIRISHGTLTLDRCTFTRSGTIRVGRDAHISRCSFVGHSDYDEVINVSGGNCVLTLDDCEFIGNSGTFAGAIYLIGSSMLQARNCLFAGNSANVFVGGGAIGHFGKLVQLSNCTFVGNRGYANAITDGPGELTQCIVRDGPDPFLWFPTPEPQLVVTYSNVEGGYPGEGNIDADPCFVSPGYWDPNGTPDDLLEDVWIPGDCHLKSQAGHWDRDTETWVRDDVTSPCIDAGDPNGFLGSEQFPNGGYVNMGAYGGTLEASRSYFGEPVCENQIAGDINGDCNIDQTDVDILLSHWLMDATPVPNVPPTLTLVSPADGSTFTAPTPVIFRVQASDPDGTVLRVRVMVGRSPDVAMTTYTLDRGESSGVWEGELRWSTIGSAFTHTVWADVMDNDGAVTTSPKIKVTLRLVD